MLNLCGQLEPVYVGVCGQTANDGKDINNRKITSGLFYAVYPAVGFGFTPFLPTVSSLCSVWRQIRSGLFPRLPHHLLRKLLINKLGRKQL